MRVSFSSEKREEAAKADSGPSVDDLLRAVYWILLGGRSRKKEPRPQALQGDRLSLASLARELRKLAGKPAGRKPVRKFRIKIGVGVGGAAAVGHVEVSAESRRDALAVQVAIDIQDDIVPSALRRGRLGEFVPAQDGHLTGAQ